MSNELFECSYCHNTYTLKEGFVLKTMQCASCQRWDDEKPLRKIQEYERESFRKQFPNGIDFPYVAGDPIW